MMKLKELFSAYKIRLQSIYPVGESQAIAQIVFEHVFNTDNSRNFLNSEMEVDENQNELLQIILKRLLNHEPLQYVIGETDFFGMKFKVNKNVLIPRPETEELVEWIVGSWKMDVGGWMLEDGGWKAEDGSWKSEDGSQKLEIKNILDIGTGSGCIAISLKKKIPDANVYAMDISEDALNVAKQNAELNNVDVNFIQDDILNFHLPSSNIHLPSSFSLIVSNPPYITFSEKKQIDENVLLHEPLNALFVADDDALIFYKEIADFALKYLNKNGLLFFEINQHKGNEVVELLTSKGFNNIELKKDMSGNDRMIKALR